MPVITATGTATVDWGLTTSCFSSKFKAKDDARRNLTARAAAICPNGYTIVNGPTYTLTVNCNLVWIGWWPDITSTYNVTATINCNATGQFPQFAYAPGQTPLEDMSEAVGVFLRHYPVAIETEPRLAALTTPDAIVAYGAEIGGDGDAQVLKQAIQAGSACKIVAPTAKDLLLDLPFGGAFSSLVDEGGIAAVKAFADSLDQAIRGGDGAGDCSGSDVKLSKGGNVVNIHIHL